MKKRPYLLLEVLIALTLVALAAPYVIRLPTRHYRAQVFRLEEFERQRIADWSFSEVKEMLLKRSIPWEKLPIEGTVTLPLADTSIDVPGVVHRKQKRWFSLTCRGEREGRQGHLYRIYQVDIHFEGSKKKFGYRVIVQRQPAPRVDFS